MRVLQDRVAVVTGAGGGIGRALALELAHAGMHVALADFDPAAAQVTAQSIEALGRRTLCVPTDVRELSQIELLLQQTLSALGGCHLMVNNAGVFHAASMLDSPTEQWRRVLDTNLWGVIHGSRVFGAHFVSQGEGHLINTASAAGLLPMPGMSSYGTSKHAVVAFSQQLRWELASSGVGVTVLCPGVVKTGIYRAPGVGLEHVDMEPMVGRSPPPEGLARKAVRAVRRNRGMVRYGPDAYVLGWLSMLPWWLLDPIGRFMARTARDFLRGNAAATPAREEPP